MTESVFLRKIDVMERRIIATAAFFGMTAVILGAFGAHMLKNLLDTANLATFETGVRYQFYHAILLLFIGISAMPEKAKKLIFYFCVVGIVLFSGSIYMLATDSLNDFDFKIIGIVTPIGGLMLIIA